MMLPGGKIVFGITTTLFLVCLLLGCVVRVVNKKGGWVEVILAINSVQALLYVLCR